MLYVGFWVFEMGVGGVRELGMLGRAVEEGVGEKEEAGALLIAGALSEMLGEEEIPLTVVPVKPKVSVDAGRVVRELREARM